MGTENTLGFEPAVVQKASEEIVSQIQNSILSGKLKPGDALPPERELIRMFARSRPTVREALRVLEMKGLISITGGGGTVVCRPETSQLEENLQIMLAMHDITPDEVSEFRNSLEMATIQYAVKRRTKEHIDQMEQLIQREQASLEDIELFTSLDRDFHELIAKAAGNGIFVILLQALRPSIEKIIAQSIRRMGPEKYKKEQEILIRCHSEIARLIGEQSEEEALRCMREHIRQFERITRVPEEQASSEETV